MNESFTEAVVRLSTTDDGELQVVIEGTSYRIGHVLYEETTIHSGDIDGTRVFHDVDCSITYVGGLGAKPVRQLVIESD